MPVEETVTIDLDDETDRWRFRCPFGHATWEPTNRHFYCSSCARAAGQGVDVDPSFEELVDTKTDRAYEREQIRLTSEFGDWRDVRGEPA